MKIISNGPDDWEYEAFLTSPASWVDEFSGLARFVRKVVASKSKLD